MTKNIIKPGVYRHYKGKEYEVIDTVTHSETMDTLVLYRTLYGEYDLWVRPYDMFTESIEVDGEAVQRFQWLKDMPQ